MVQAQPAGVFPFVVSRVLRLGAPATAPPSEHRVHANAHLGPSS